MQCSAVGCSLRAHLEGVVLGNAVASLSNGARWSRVQLKLWLHHVLDCRGQCMGAPHGCVLVVAKVARWCGGKLALMAQPGMLLLLTMYGCPDVSSLLLPAACGS